MRRHLTWIIPVVLLPVIYFACGLVGWALNLWATSDPSIVGWAGLISVVLLLASLTGIVFCIVFAIRNGHRTYRAWQRSKGRLTKRERAEAARLDDAQLAWNAAVSLVGDLQQERFPEPVQVWGLIPRPGEQFFYDVDAQYQRFYGTTAQWSQRSGFYMGRPGFVVAGLVTDAIANSTAKSAAMRAAAEQWREHQQARILISNQRLAINVNGQWLSFDFAAMTACYPDLDHWAVTFEFPSAEPLRLIGKGSPLVAVWSVLATHGRSGVLEHPSLALVRPG
ncbi:hypothetical protein [Agromyces cerinus]|uniref:Uncharacterized protein n=1 Tax=Agromyces cerinus subsp. cerinus TaxID=232089 RepID=A0A1N6F1R3_9MICO|nr:hypothetical protein [Agromyces cerinus]SIN89215.1 hypothetical protein SAMN05443544_1661 [Agromyces cerinus subsp. cerinus]